MAQPVNLWLSIRFGQLEVNMSADEVSSYAPDVMHDLTQHAIRSFTEAIAELRAHGVLGQDESDDPAEEDEAEDDDTTTE